MREGELPLGVPTKIRRMPSEPIVRSAEIEDCYRWTLMRAWGAGPCILWCGLNPSTADGRHDDPTMQREMGFSFRWGFGSLIKVNVYPFIASRTPALRTWRASWTPADSQPGDPYESWLHNMDVVRKQLREGLTCVAAWGNGADPDDLKEFLDEATFDYDTSEHDGFGTVRIPVEWKCLGKNADGSPRHPLARGGHRVPDDAVLQPWGNK